MEGIIEHIVNYLRNNMPDILNGKQYIFAGYPQVEPDKIGIYVVLNSEEKLRFLSFDWFKARIHIYIIVDKDYEYADRRGQELIAYLNDLLIRTMMNDTEFHDCKLIESVPLGYDEKYNVEGIRVVYEVVSEYA